METNTSNSVREKYKELLQYISKLGDRFEIICNVNTDVTIKVKDYDGKELISVHLYQPINLNRWHPDYLRISWKISPKENFGRVDEFHQDMDQKVIFNILLYKVIDWKLSTFDERFKDIINSTLNSDTITDWLKTKEDQIRMEERAKIESHLSVEDLKKVIKEELSKVSINLKIGDK